MLVLRYVALIALATWLGGLVMLGGAAAPAAFDVTAARHIADSTELAGALVGEMLRRFHLICWTAGGVLLLTLVARAILGPRPRRFAWRAAVALLMLAASVYAGLVIDVQIESIRRQAGGAIAALPATDARRMEFGRLHGLSMAFEFMPLLGGLALMYWELKE